jgi:replicative DNA helicase
MTAAQTWFRMACGDLQIDVNTVRSGAVDESTKNTIKAYSRQLAAKYQKNIVVYQAPMKPVDILGAAMMEHPDIVYVDTMKNVAGKGNISNQEWYDGVCNFLRINVAQRVGCHVQVLHHVNRSSKNESREPTIQDLMYAGESDADSVFLLHRKEKPEGSNEQIAEVDWIVGKSRFGWTGTESLNFHLPKQQFFGMSRKV